MTKRLKWKACKYPGCDGTGNIRDPNCYPLYIEVQCPMCALHHDLSETRAEIERLKALVKELEEELLTAASDHDRLQCIINGTWPTADEIIKRDRAARPSAGTGVSDGEV